MKYASFYLTLILSLALTNNSSANPLSQYSDEFDFNYTTNQWSRVNQTEGWNVEHLEIWNVNQTQPSRMVMQPYTSTWYANWRGPMVYKQITGNFAITTQIHISDLDDSDADDIPSSNYSLGGLMIRTPTGITNPETDWSSGIENYVFLSLGHGVGSQPQFEVKTTINGNSQLELTSSNGYTTADIQIARINNAVITLLRLPNQDWQVHRRFERTDMPDTLQVGLVTYSDWDKLSTFDPYFFNGHNVEDFPEQSANPALPFNADLRAGFEHVRYYQITPPEELQNINLVTQATNEQLLSFLGQNPARLVGDYSNDQILNAPDIDTFFTQMSLEPNPLLDLNADGTPATSEDLNFLIRNIFHTEFGDFNLDRRVNLEDLARLATNFGSESATWAQGDVNGDNIVNLEDLARLATYFGYDAHPQPAASLTNGISIPEPNSFALFSFVLIILSRQSTKPKTSI